MSDGGSDGTDGSGIRSLPSPPRRTRPMPEYISMHEKQTPRQLAKAQPSPLRISAALQVYVPLAVSCVLRPVSKQAYVEQPGNRTATATGRRHRRALGPVLTRSRSVGRLLFQQGLSEDATISRARCPSRLSEICLCPRAVCRVRTSQSPPPTSIITSPA